MREGERVELLRGGGGRDLARGEREKCERVHGGDWNRSGRPRQGLGACAGASRGACGRWAGTRALGAWRSCGTSGGFYRGIPQLRPSGQHRGRVIAYLCFPSGFAYRSSTAAPAVIPHFQAFSRIESTALQCRPEVVKCLNCRRFETRLGVFVVLHMDEVTGSNPVSPTLPKALQPKHFVLTPAGAGCGFQTRHSVKLFHRMRRRTPHHAPAT